MSLNVTIPLSYKEAVKVQYQDEPEVYSQFLKLIHDFDSQDIDIFGVMQRISQLFHGNPVLIRGFNTFLPVGYCVDVSSNTVTISTPQGTLTGGPDNFRSTRIIKPPSELGPNLLPYPSNITPPLTIYPPLGFRSITPQANGVFRVPEFNPLQERSVRDRDRDPLLNGQAPSDKPRPKNKRVKPADEDQEDEVSLHLLR
ncbi:uncharacterized protein EV420DRAFT_1276099 [Desarmillaria tabescens]|uniref:PAH2 domain-containing protein n=1 Tax=Armillaria tabescens TaxID=1929756 RepID=A0AA39JTV9_ARMTA|nr:uncharacterized protein EV420DRAFT_1276099 [Desarmillaria tabescens]KAK0447354.1 hypothetical protein EV420DRAFT_1276099 [Desarmillaria tabescens]